MKINTVTLTQFVIPNSLQHRVLSVSDEPISAAHPGERKMYRTLRESCYWPGLHLNCYNNVQNYHEWGKERARVHKHTRLTRLSPARSAGYHIRHMVITIAKMESYYIGMHLISDMTKISLIVIYAAFFVQTALSSITRVDVSFSWLLEVPVPKISGKSLYSVLPSRQWVTTFTHLIITSAPNFRHEYCDRVCLKNTKEKSTNTHWKLSTKVTSRCCIHSFARSAIKETRRK